MWLIWLLYINYLTYDMMTATPGTQVRFAEKSLKPELAQHQPPVGSSKEAKYKAKSLTPLTYWCLRESGGVDPYKIPYITL